MNTKTILSLIAIVYNLSCRAYGSDVYPILQTIDGKVYTNAEISSVTASYAVVFYGDGSGTKIPLTNFPPDLQKKYHFDPALAAAAEQKDSEKKAKQLAIRNQAQKEFDKLSSWTGEVEQAQILKALPLNQYQISIGRDRVIVCLQNVPYDISQFASRITELRQALMHPASGAGLARRSQIEIAQNISQMREELSELSQTEMTMTKILVAPTKLQSSGVAVWRYMGKPQLKSKNSAP